MTYLPKTYEGGGYDVTINTDRSINVRAGDWLSKYSMAIYGDFNHIGEFYRKNGSGYEEIINKDLIHTGETLYHPGPLPGEPAGGHPPVVPPPGGGDGEKPPLNTNYVADFLRWFYNRFVLTDWEVIGSGGGDLSWSVVTLQYATLGVRKRSVAVDTWFHALAGGLTLGWPSEGFSGGGSFATTQFPSVGTIVRFAWRRELTLNDFRHGIVVLEFGGGFFAGASLCVVIFGIQFPLYLLMGIDDYFRKGNQNALAAAFNRTAPAGCAILAGGTLGLPGVSVAGRMGAMYDRGYFGI